MGDTPPPKSFPKVVVVGAGMAGLSATRELLRRGWPARKVVLVEASGKIGGRMRTRRHRTGVMLDHGAAYIHGIDGNPLAELAKEAGIGLKQVSESNPWLETTPSVSFCHRGELADESEATATHEAYCELMGRIRMLARGCDDANVPAGDAVEKLLLDEPFRSLPVPELSRLRLRLASLALWHGCDMQDMQLRSLDFEDKPFHGGQGVYGDFPGPHCVVEGGVERVAEAVASPEVWECLRLNSPVDRIALVVDTVGEREDGNPRTNATAAAAVEAGSSGCSGGVGGLGGDEIEKDRDMVAKGGGVLVSIRREVTATTAIAAEAAAAPAVVEGGRGEDERKRELVRADAVIVTVPLSVLQSGELEFDPPLAEETAAALSRLSMGTYEKIIMEFEEPFWPADAPFIGCCCSPPPSPPPLSPTPPPPPATAAATVSAVVAAPAATATAATDAATAATATSGEATAATAAAGASTSVTTAPAAAAAAALATAAVAATPQETAKNGRLSATGAKHTTAAAPTDTATSNGSIAAATEEAIAAAAAAAMETLQAPKTCAPATAVGCRHSAATVEGRDPCQWAARAAGHYSCSPLPAIPIFLENYLWLKGVPVLTAAVTGERARILSASAAAAAAAGAVATAAGGEGVGETGGWRAAHAREMYHRMIKPALVQGLCGEEAEVPEPVSVFVTSWAEEPFQRGSYSFFPLGARDDDIHKVGQGAAYGLPLGAEVKSGPGGVPGGDAPGAERVFFAGEATVPGLEGSMHGAYLSGVRAVEDVAHALGLHQLLY